MARTEYQILNRYVKSEIGQCPTQNETVVIGPTALTTSAARPLIETRTARERSDHAAQRILSDDRSLRACADRLAPPRERRSRPGQLTCGWSLSAPGAPRRR